MNNNNKNDTDSIFIVGLDEEMQFGWSICWGLFAGLVVDALVRHRCTTLFNELRRGISIALTSYLPEKFPRTWLIVSLFVTRHLAFCG